MINIKKNLLPMSCDILKFEYHLIPGTIILVDGRTSNATFLKKILKEIGFIFMI